MKTDMVRLDNIGGLGCCKCREQRVLFQKIREKFQHVQNVEKRPKLTKRKKMEIAKTMANRTKTSLQHTRPDAPCQELQNCV